MFSKLLRRTHMYLALFLTPWVLLYTVSTLAMNHRAWFLGKPVLQAERELTWNNPLRAAASPKEIAARLLQDINLDGAHSVSATAAALVINRQDAVAPRRITLTRATNRVLVEREAFRPPSFLERMHRRRGYQQPYATDAAWAFSVDTVIFALVFWGASGLWLWWEMKRTRLAGALSLLGGVAVFALFVALG